MRVCPAKTQISLGIRPVWSESSLCTQWIAEDPRFLHADSKDSDQTGRLPRLIWVFPGRTHFVGFVMSWLKSLSTYSATIWQKASDSSSTNSFFLNLSWPCKRQTVCNHLTNNQRTFGPVSLTCEMRICWIRTNLEIHEHSMLYKLYRRIKQQIWPCHTNGQGQPRVIIWKKPQGMGIQPLGTSSDRDTFLMKAEKSFTLITGCMFQKKALPSDFMHIYS